MLLCFGILLAGCATRVKTTPIALFALTPASAANRANQTRRFETPNSDELLSASAAVLQDLGFQITETDRTLGFVRAAKERSAREYGQEVNQGVIAFLTTLLSAFAAVGGVSANTMLVVPVDLQQQISASLVAQPIDAEDRSQEVRIVFYRLVWQGAGSSGNQSIAPGGQRMEMIRDPEIYQTFYARLAKAVFLEAHRI